MGGSCHWAWIRGLLYLRQKAQERITGIVFGMHFAGKARALRCSVTDWAAGNWATVGWHKTRNFRETVMKFGHALALWYYCVRNGTPFNGKGCVRTARTGARGKVRSPKR